MACAMEVRCVVHCVPPLWIHHTHSLQMGLNARRCFGGRDTAMVDEERMVLERCVRNGTVAGNLVTRDIERGEWRELETGHDCIVL